MEIFLSKICHELLDIWFQNLQQTLDFGVLDNQPLIAQEDWTKSSVTVFQRQKKAMISKRQNKKEHSTPKTEVGKTRLPIKYGGKN